MNAGDLPGALQHYKRALKTDRRNAGVLLEAGVAAAQHGDLKLAGDYLIASIRNNDGSADAHFNLGHVYLAQKRYELALRSFQQTQKLDPAYPDLDYSLAEALFERSQFADALKYVTKATEASPFDEDAWLLRARSEDKTGQTAQAEHTYQHLLKLNPNHLDAQLLLARHYARRFMHKQAVELLDKLSEVANLPTTAYVQMADAYGSSHLAHKAVEVLKPVVEADPEDSAAHAVIGSAYIDLGDFDRSEEHLRKSLALNKQQSLAYQSLADIKRLRESDRADLENLYRMPSLDNQGRMHCGFALYHLNDIAGHYNDAFAALTIANSVMSEEDPQDVKANQSQLLKLIDILSASFLAQRNGQGFDRAGPVFIVGMPRSGTTLTEQLLANHPSVNAGGERTDIIEVRSSLAGFPETLQDLDADWTAATGKKVWDAMFAASPKATVATDKLPGNYAFIGLIKWILPSAKFIYCKRTPEANALSIFEQHFMTLPFSRDLKDIGLVYRNHLKIMDHWRRTCGIDVLEVQYEELVSNPEPVARQIFDYVELQWNSAYLDLTRVDRQINTASRWQVRQPINTASVERWRRYEKHLGPFAEALAAVD